jgi:hypothetical protein
MTKIAKAQLLGRWLHSNEEDTASQSVYRPATFSFGPARGRRGFELRPDGSCTSIGIAPQDGSAEQPCRWEFKDGNEPRAILHLPTGETQVLRVASVDDQKLVVRK